MGTLPIASASSLSFSRKRPSFPSNSVTYSSVCYIRNCYNHGPSRRLALFQLGTGKSSKILNKEKPISFFSLTVSHVHLCFGIEFCCESQGKDKRSRTYLYSYNVVAQIESFKFLMQFIELKNIPFNFFSLAFLVNLWGCQGCYSICCRLIRIILSRV